MNARVAVILSALLGLLPASFASAQDVTPPAAATNDLRLLILPLDRVGGEPTNAQTTSLSERVRNADAVAIATPPLGDTIGAHAGSLVEELRQLGVPIFLVEDARTVRLAPREPAQAGTPRSLDLDSDTLNAIRAAVGLAPGTPSAGGTGLVIRSSIAIGTGDDAYRLRRLELGLPGRRIWLIHSPATEEESGSVGIQLRQDW